MARTANEGEKIKELAAKEEQAEGTTRVVSGDDKRAAYVDPNTPDVLKAQSLQELVSALGEEMVMQKIMAQLVIDFRSQVRGKMESYDKENESYRYDLDDIESADYADWKPETRQRKTAEEKAAELLANFTPDQIKAALAKAGKS
jgi:hypothetical protein